MGPCINHEKDVSLYEVFNAIADVGVGGQVAACIQRETNQDYRLIFTSVFFVMFGVISQQAFRQLLHS